MSRASSSPRHRLLLELGRGGMGTVYLAVTEGPGGFSKLKVIKRLRPDLASDPQFLQMFLDEARLSALLHHPNIVQTNEVGFDGHHYFIEMEYLEGQSLEAVVRRATRAGKVPLAYSLWILAQVLAGLEHAHGLTDPKGDALRIVHRDVSPHNVFVTFDGLVKVLDFGIAKAANSNTETATGMVKGKATYMAPEQAMRRPVDRRADLFAVGVMLWQALTGARLWSEMSDAQIFVKLEQGEIEPPSSVAKDVPPALEAICMKALAKDRERRFATAAEFQEALEESLEATGERVGPRQIGKWVTELFADQRRAVKAEIDAQLLASAEVVRDSVGDVPVLGQAKGVLETTTGPTKTADLRSQTKRGGGAVSARTTETMDDATRSVGGITSEPARRGRGRRALLLAAATALGLGAIALVALRPRSTTRDGRAVEASSATGGCKSNRECANADAAALAVCRAGACVSLTAHGCVPHMEKGDAANDATLWIGVMFPTTGAMAADQGIPLGNAVEVGRFDFAHISGGVPTREAPDRARPLAFVACNDDEDAAGKAKYLAEELRVPAIIGFNSSAEVVQLATTELISHHVLSVVAGGSSALITSIPHPTGSPRMVWRTALSVTSTVPAIAAAVRELEEPALRAAKAVAKDAPIRVAILRRGTNSGLSFASTLDPLLRFNGKSAAENDASFVEVVYGDPTGAEAKADYPRALRDLIAFRPNVIILFGGDELAPELLGPLEKSWSAAYGPLPRYLAPVNLEGTLLDFVREKPERRGRIFGVSVPSTTLPNLQFATRYNERFSERVTPGDAPSAAYDAIYLVAYAAYAAEEPLTGEHLAMAIPRLLRPSPKIDVGPAHILEGFAALREGGIDLNGTMSPLDFSTSNGETGFNIVITCARVGRHGEVVGEMDSGLTYSPADDHLRGTNQCQ